MAEVRRFHFPCPFTYSFRRFNNSGYHCPDFFVLIDYAGLRFYSSCRSPGSKRA